MINSIIRKDTALSDALEAFDSGQPNKASDLCTMRIEQKGETASALLLRSMCYVSMGKSQSAVDDNGRALNMLSLSGNDLLAFADDSAEYGLEPGYCAAVMENAARELERQAELSDKLLFSAANAFNRAGICRYRAGSPLEQESADFERGRELLLKARRNNPADREQQMLLALVSSNLAECCFRGGDHSRSRRLFEEASSEIEPYIRDDMTYLHQYSFCQSCLFDIDRTEDNNVDAQHRISHLIHIYEGIKGDLSDDQRLALSACYIRRGSVRFQMGNYSGDVSDCTRAAALIKDIEEDMTQLARIYFARAEAYEQLGKLEKAAEDYGRAASIPEQSDSRKDLAQTIGLRRFLEACCYERLGDLASAAKSYRLAADGFSVYEDIPDDTSLPPSQPDREMAALCRFRCGKCLCRTEEKDYHGSFAELTSAFHILDVLDDNMLVTGKKAIIAGSIGELFELFDDFGRASAYFSLSEDLMNGLDGDSREQIIAVTGQMLDPTGEGINAAGLFGDGDFLPGDGDIVSDDMFSDDIDDIYDEDDEDYEDDIDDYFDDDQDELPYGGEDYDAADIGTDNPAFPGCLSACTVDQSGDKGKKAAEQHKEPDSGDEIWGNPSDDTPKG